MPMSNAERAAAWRKRQRDDPEKCNEYRRKERERYLRKKEKGVVKSISDITIRGQRQQRRQWRTNQQAKRIRDSVTREGLAALGTPPVSPEAPVENQRAIVMRRTGRRRIRRDRSKAYRDLFQLKIQLRTEKKLKEKYKKRCQRLSEKKNNPNIFKNELATKQSERIKTSLVSQAILNRVKARYLQSKNQRDKQFISSIVCSYKLLKKLRLAKFARKKIGFSRHYFNSSRESSVPDRKRKWTGGGLKAVEIFLCRDDNSRIKPDKKATITRQGEKRQIRLLTDDLTNLYGKFKLESNCKMSYSLFCAMRPFYIRKPTPKDRETCQCKLHENFKFKMEKCFQIKALPHCTINEALGSITCDFNNKECMYRECPECIDKELVINPIDTSQTVFWMMWKTKREDREKTVNGETISSTVNVTIKEKQQGTLQELIDLLNTDIQRMGRHIYNITNQYKVLHKLKEEASPQDLIIHMDFSENYNCKYSEEIQSMHFGSSKRQISLHTGVAYSSSRTYSFCSMSDCLKHGPAAIWSHLDPVLKYIKEEVPDAKVVHFISDGPTTQYRNKQNFYLFSTRMYQFGFTEATWNFLEAGHGKGAADGIGGVIKRTADRLVDVQGKDVVNASGLFEILQDNTSVKLFLIKEENINEIETIIPANLKPLPRTMQIHQVLTSTPGEVSHRVLSCFCRKPGFCQCYGVKSTKFPIQIAEEQSTTVVEENIEEVREKQPTENALQKVHLVQEHLISRYCVVRYDDVPYPGIIVSVDDEEELEVNVMHRAGVNRYFWPTTEDVIWYQKGDIITLLENAPKPVTKRHCQIEKSVYDLIANEMGLE